MAEAAASAGGGPRGAGLSGPSALLESQLLRDGNRNQDAFDVLDGRCAPSRKP